jgi:hypothetical protein
MIFAKRLHDVGIWFVLFCFVGQITLAQTIGAAGVPPVGVSGEIVPSDSQPRSSVPKVNSEIVPSDSQPRSSVPKVNSEIVPSDSQPRSSVPKVNSEIVPSDSQPRSSVPKVNSEIVPSDAQPRKPTPTSGVPGINPFVGEIAVGASLLITYGPQIIALAISVATVASAINAIMGKGKGKEAATTGLTGSVGGKLKSMLQLLLGPLSLTTGTAKEGVEGVSGELLRVAKFITNNLSMPVDKVNGHVERALYLSQDVTKLSERGKGISDMMVNLAQETQRDLSGVVAGGEVQLFRDGANTIAGKLKLEAQRSGEAFGKSLENSRLSVAALSEVKGDIAGKLKDSGKAASEVTLYDLGISGSAVSKKLVEARKYMVMSKNELLAAEKGTGSVHAEIMALLGGIKKELEDFAKNNGISKDLLERTIKEQKSSASSATIPGVKGDIGRLHAATGEKLTQEVSFMVDDLRQMNTKANRMLRQVDPTAAAGKQLSESVVSESGNQSPTKGDAAFERKLSAYRELMKVMSRDPGNRQAIQEARAAFDLAERDYSEMLSR